MNFEEYSDHRGVGAEGDLELNLPQLEAMSDCSEDRDSGGQTDSDGALDESEEEDLSDEDDSQIDDLVDDLQIKFRTLVGSKIAEAEEFFDDPELLQSTCLFPSVDTLFPKETVLPHGGSKEHSGDTATQTDDDIFITKTSASVASSESVPCPGTTPEQARLEIAALRDIRNCLVLDRQHWETRRKATDPNLLDEIRLAECTVYQIEEAIEAVDTTIEFKNELILGQSPRKTLGEDQLLETSEGQLLTRLETLSVDELRRLLCKYINKVVEMRFSTRRLEKNLEHLDSVNKQLSSRIAKEQTDLLKMDTELQSQLLLILQPNGADTLLRRKKEQLVAAKKKQQILEHSLTALLVRHGHLANGADDDVKQVVKKLGIHTSHTAAPPSRHGVHPTGPISSHRPSSSRRNARIHTDIDPSRHSRLPIGHHKLWDKEPVLSPPGGGPQAEVRREKKRIIIQANETRHHYK